MLPLIRKLKKDFVPSPSRVWYNKWVKDNAKGCVLDVGKSTFWSYGFPTIDNNNSLKPTYHQDICNSNFASDFYDVVLVNGMMEFVEQPQIMVNEVNRILKPGGTAIFGFVGKGYKPYKRGWLFYEEGDIDFSKFEIVEKKSFGNQYHYIVCKKLN